MPYLREKWPGGRVFVSSTGERTYHIFKMRNGRRYSVSTRCSNLKAALKELERWELDPDSYRPQGTSELTITKELIDAFVFEGRAKGNTEGRLWRKRSVMAWWQEGFKADVRTITPERAYSLVEGVPDGERKKSVLKTCLSWLQSTGRTERDLGEGIRVVPSVPAQFTRPKVVALSRHRKVMEKLDDKYRDLCTVLAGTGCHVEELGRFIEAGRIEYPEAQGEDPPRYVLVTPRHKSGDIHKTEVSEVVEAAAFRAKERAWFNRVLLGRALSKACRDAKVATYGPSWYRHSVATWAIEKGADPAAVSAFLGHRHPSTVKRFYATHAVVPKVPTLE